MESALSKDEISGNRDEDFIVPLTNKWMVIDQMKVSHHRVIMYFHPEERTAY